MAWATPCVECPLISRSLAAIFFYSSNSSGLNVFHQTWPWPRACRKQYINIKHRGLCPETEESVWSLMCSEIDPNSSSSSPLVLHSLTPHSWTGDGEKTKGGGNMEESTQLQNCTALYISLLCDPTATCNVYPEWHSWCATILQTHIK